jgi:hypothetical protein
MQMNSEHFYVPSTGDRIQGDHKYKRIEDA